jgi:hypothetical protein
MPPVPKWLASLPKDEAAIALVRFKLEYAALMYSQTGTIRDLSLGLGKSIGLLTNSAPRWRQLPPMYCIEIEKLLGRDVITREWLNPDIFTIEG